MRLKRILNREITYWPPTGYDDNGKPRYGAPIAIMARWQDTNEQALNAQGQTFIARALVYVDRVLELGGALWKGPVGSASSSNPFLNEGAGQIQKFSEFPNRKQTQALYTAYL